MRERSAVDLRMGKFLSCPIRMSPKPPRDRKQNVPPIQEDHRARFFEDYRKEAEEYDREFIKKYDEDLNTTLIFVSSYEVLIRPC